jgi:hypothetical protein
LFVLGCLGLGILDGVRSKVRDLWCFACHIRCWKKGSSLRLLTSVKLHGWNDACEPKLCIYTAKSLQPVEQEEMLRRAFLLDNRACNPKDVFSRPSKHFYGFAFETQFSSTSKLSLDRCHRQSALGVLLTPASDRMHCCRSGCRFRVRRLAFIRHASRGGSAFADLTIPQRH